MKKLHILTLGCKVNQHESAVVADHFHKLGYELSAMEAADLIFINTCTVTNRTDYKSRNLIRKAIKLKEIKPSLRIFVTGCYSQRSFEELKTLEGLDLIIDNQYKTDVSAWLDTLSYNFTDIMEADTYHHIPFTGMMERTRAFQKIQDGCDFYCTYCAVPYARGHSRSCSFEDVVNQARVLVANGYQEIVLGGINLGLYHDQTKTLKDVIKALNDLEGLKLIRLSSIEPQLITEELLDVAFSMDKVCPHFHIPLQSGSDSVLQRMGRRYRTSDVARLVESIHSHYADAAIGMDLITAFPGETDAEFEETNEFIRSLGISYLHVFTYSKRKGTPAAQMKEQIHGSIANQRSKTLSALNEKLKCDYRDRLIHRETLLRGIAEEKIGNKTTALSDHFVRIYTSKDKPLNKMMSITATLAHQDGISD
jgi:threonylcarbamoyladenosine tRNA methylthiotransferase MtaB